jgi:hypothetical protein
MSVLACDRFSCQNIMCDKHSYEYGYICYECFEELVDLGINTDVEDFMNSTKRTLIKRDKDYALEFFSEIFPDRD